MPKLTDDQLIREVESRETSSYGINDAALSDDRAKAFNYYIGAPFGNEMDGRSQVISRDVLDCVEAALPQLLKVFVSGDEVVRFDPRGPEDEQAAEQETAAVNYYTMEKNDGFHVMYTWFKDALLSKNGYVKVWWEEEEESETESYQGLSDDQLTLLAQDTRVEIEEHTAYPDPTYLQGANAAQMIQAGAPIVPPPTLHDVKLRITEEKGCIKIDNVAPEDILVGVDTKTTQLQKASFVQHRSMMAKEEIEEQGWKLPDSAQVGNESAQYQESLSRNLYNEQEESTQLKQYLVKDTYIRVNGEFLRLVIIGNEIIHREDAEVIPFACLTPHIMPHRHIGLSYADLTMDIQLQKSTLLRGMFDAQYLANQPRFGISDRVNLDDMLTSRPGGAVRVTGNPAENIMPLMTPTFPQSSFSLIEYLDSANTKRTGVSAYDQGLDADSLNKTATGATILENNAQKRVELVARVFANTGVKDLFVLVHRLVRKYNTRPDIIRLKKKWVMVDPREWKERKDMSVTVGLGTGNKDQQLMHLTTILQAQKEGLSIGVSTPKNIFNALTKLTQNAGFKSPDEFWTDPGDKPFQPGPDPKIAVKQMELQADQQKFNAESVIKLHESESSALLEMKKEQWKQEMQARETQHQNELEAQREFQRMQLEAAAEERKTMLEAQQKENDRAFEIWKTEFTEAAKIVQSQIAAKNSDPALNQAEQTASAEVSGAMGQTDMMAIHAETLNAIRGVMEQMARPKTIVRGADGRAVGLQ